MKHYFIAIFIILLTSIALAETEITADYINTTGYINASGIIRAGDWTNISITESQISDLIHASTAIQVGFGLNDTGTFNRTLVVLNINTTLFQVRITSSCSAGSSIRVIAEDGTVTCETDTDTQQTSLPAGNITSGTFSGEYNFSGTVNVTNTLFSNVSQSLDWTNVSITESQISDLAHRGAGTDLDLSGNDLLLEATIDSVTTINGFFDSACASGTFATEVTSTGGYTCTAPGFTTSLPADNITSGVFSGEYNFSGTVNITNTLLTNVSQSLDWTNVSITESQISDLTHTAQQTSLPADNITSGIFSGEYNFSGTVNVTNTLITNVSQSLDWTNVSITESQISDLAHRGAGTDLDLSGNDLLLETTIDSVTTINDFFDAACSSGTFATEVTSTGGYSCTADAVTAVQYGEGINDTGTTVNGTLATINVNDSVFQKRVVETCSAGSSIRSILQNGSIGACETDDDSGATAHTAVQYGFGINDTGTTVNGSLATIDVNTSEFQVRVSSTCATGSAIRIIAEDGTVTCETDDDTQQTSLPADNITSGIFSGEYNFSGTVNITNTLRTNVSESLDWTNVSITESQISDLAHRGAGTDLDLSGNDLLLETTIDSVTTINGFFDVACSSGTFATEVTTTGGYTCTAPDFTTSLPADNITSGIFSGEYNFSGTVNVTNILRTNVSESLDWTNVSITESQISDLAHRGAGTDLDLSGNNLLLETTIDSVTTINGFFDSACSAGTFATEVTTTGGYSCATASDFQANQSLNTSDSVQFHFINVSNLNVTGQINAFDWTNVSITESQINDLAHRGAGTDLDLSGNDLLLETTIDSVTTINGFFDAACATGTFATEVTSTGGYSCIAPTAADVDSGIFLGTYNFSENTNFTKNVTILGNLTVETLVSCNTIDTDASGGFICGSDETAGSDFSANQSLNTSDSVQFDNVTIGTFINATDWTNVSITESQISDLAHRGAGTDLDLSGNDLLLETTIDSVTTINGFFDSACAAGTFATEVTTTGGYTCTAPTAADVDSGLFPGEYNFSGNVNVSLALRAGDWTNVSITESQVSDLAHRGAGTDLDLSGNDLLLETTIDSVTTINGFFDSACGAGTFATEVTTTGGYSCTAPSFTTSLPADNITSGIFSGEYNFSGTVNITNTLITNVSQSLDWTNVSITESQISDLAHRGAGTDLDLSGNDLLLETTIDSVTTINGFFDTACSTGTFATEVTTTGGYTCTAPGFTTALPANNITSGVFSGEYNFSGTVNVTNTLLTNVSQSLDWTNVSITESQISDLAHRGAGTDLDLSGNDLLLETTIDSVDTINTFFDAACGAGTFATEVTTTGGYTCTAPTAADVDPGTYPSGDYIYSDNLDVTDNLTVTGNITFGQDVASRIFNNGTGIVIQG